MRRFLAVLIVTLVAFAGAAGAGSQPSQPILLKTKVIVEGPVIQLGDLFDGLDERAATPIARAPAPGNQAEVGARWLAAVARAYGLPWRPSSRLDRAVIERASLVIETRQIEQATLVALGQRGVKGKISLVLDNPALRLHLPSDATPTVLITGLSHDPGSGRFIAHLVAPAQGTPLARATVTGRAVELIEIPVLRRRMEPGEVISRQDIEWLSVRADRVGRNAAVDVTTLLGMSPRRPIRAREAVQISELREPIVVARNSLVTIRLATPRLILTAQGRALEAGAQGGVVRVMNTKSKKVINASVAAPGIVEVLADTVSAANSEGLR